MLVDYAKRYNENNFTDLMIRIFQDQNDYFSKNNLIKLNKENTWGKNKSKLIELINENWFGKNELIHLLELEDR